MLPEPAGNLVNWIGALGTVAAVVVTAAIALAGFFRELVLRNQSSENMILVALRTVWYAAQALQDMDQHYQRDAGPASVRHGAKHFLSSHEWLETMVSIDELRPQDLPDATSSGAYSSSRRMIRHANYIMRSIADADSSIDGKISWPNLSGHHEHLSAQAKILEMQSREYISLFRPPRWLRIIVLRRKMKKLDRQLDAIRRSP